MWGIGEMPFRFERLDCRRNEANLLEPQELRSRFGDD